MDILCLQPLKLKYAAVLRELQELELLPLLKLLGYNSNLQCAQHRNRLLNNLDLSLALGVGLLYSFGS